MAWFPIIWGTVAIPLVAVVDGGFLGFIFSLGSPTGALVGILATAALLYGQMFWLLAR